MFYTYQKSIGGRIVLNQEKVRIMTKLAIYEEGKGKGELEINKYFKHDYIRLQVIKAFVCSTLGFLLLLGLIALYQMEYLILNVTKLNFSEIGKYILLIYIMVGIFYIIIAGAYATMKFNRAKKGLTKYNLLLNKLKKFYDTENIVKQ